MANNLTVKQEKFIQGLIKGLSQREAYKQAYNAENMKDNTIDRKAHELLKVGKVKARHDELKDKVVKEIEEEGIFTATEVLKGIADIIQATKKNDPKTALKGYEMYGKYHKLFIDRVESTNTNKNINLEVDSEEEADRIIEEARKNGEI